MNSLAFIKKYMGYFILLVLINPAIVFLSRLIGSMHSGDLSILLIPLCCVVLIFIMPPAIHLCLMRKLHQLKVGSFFYIASFVLWLFFLYIWERLFGSSPSIVHFILLLPVAFGLSSLGCMKLFLQSNPSSIGSSEEDPGFLSTVILPGSAAVLMIMTGLYILIDVWS